jgi:putative ABC transport system permease protein
MSLFRQIASVTAMNIRSLPQRAGSSAVIVIGIAGVVGVLVSVFAMSKGITETMIQSGKPDHAIVLRTGADNEGSSSIPQDAAFTIMDAPGIARGKDGELLASTEMYVSVNLQRRKDDTRAAIIVRGVSPESYAFRDKFELVEGRMYKPGLREVIVGKRASEEFQGVGVGDQVTLRDGPWDIVGAFETGGDLGESVMLTDIDTLQSAYQRTLYSSVRVKLESPEAFADFNDALTTNPSLDVYAVPESEYFERQAESVKPLFTVITGVVGTIMALGALFAALNTMYSAVSTRAAEIATLRAIGYGAAGVVISVVAEALLLALLGAFLGAAIAFMLFDGNNFALGGTAVSVVGQMKVTPPLIAAGVIWALAVGGLGGLFPAIRAGRLPVATALRAV